MTDSAPKTLRDSTAVRWAVLLLVSFTMLAAYYFADMIAPLQTLMERSYQWTPSNYGFFSGAEYALNVAGMLIVSGIVLDKMGIRFTGTTAAATMLLGALVKLYALTAYFGHGGFGYGFFDSFWKSMPATAKLAAIGFGIFGMGVEMCSITTSRVVVKWFSGKEMALAMGMQLATARLGASVAFFFSASIAGLKVVDGHPQGHVLRPVYVGATLLTIGLLSFVTHTFFDVKLDKETNKSLGGPDPSEEFHVSDLRKIVTNPGFVVISLLCVLFYSGVFPFLKYAVNMMQNKLGVSADVGGMISGLLPVGTILLTPLIGGFLDKKGRGATLMIFGSALLCLAHLTFALVPLNMPIAIASVVVLGIAFSLIPAAMWPSVPKIVEERYLGSAFALVFWTQNVGLMFIPWLIGVILEAVNPGVTERVAAGDATAVYNYTVPMLLFAALGGCAVLLAFLLRVIDGKRRYGLELPNKKSAAPAAEAAA